VALKLNYYPIHTHYLPAGLDEIELVAALVCIEMNPKLLRTYYGCTYSGQEIAALTFLRNWHELSSGCRPLNFRPYFALEGEAGLGDLHDLSEMRALGLLTIQLQRERRETVFFRPETGLTEMGKCLLHKMADLDMFLDLSHLHGPVLNYVLAHVPCRRIVSHVVCRDLFPWSLTARANSMSAEELLACNAHLYGVPFIDDLVSPRACSIKAKRWAEIRHVAEHLVRLTEIVGTERVALGPDYFDYGALNDSNIEIGLVEGLDQGQGMIQLCNELQNLGLNQSDVANIFWGNAARVLPPAIEACV
jgi:microsomal dipeptidase-like Zn-dependent dipeptidase